MKIQSFVFLVLAGFVVTHMQARGGGGPNSSKLHKGWAFYRDKGLWKDVTKIISIERLTVGDTEQYEATFEDGSHVTAAKDAAGKITCTEHQDGWTSLCGEGSFRQLKQEYDKKQKELSQDSAAINKDIKQTAAEIEKEL